MAGRVDAHPSAAILQALGLGKLDDTQVGTVMEHLETCVGCLKVVTGQAGDDFLARLREAHSASPSPATAQSLAGVAVNTRPPGGNQLPAIGNLPAELAANQQYEVVRELGRGGMGVVYLARNRLLARQEVLKVVNQEMLERSGGKERFLREMQSAARLSHPNVVTAYSALQLGEMLVFAMEYVEGEDLAKVVKAHGPLPVANACYYAHQVALGLQHACDKNMVHRDIKPQNLILARQGKKHIVKILDFGLAKVLREKADESDLTGTGKMLGTPDYVAPEQSLDAAHADIRADLYSLGCTLYYLLTGSAPFRGKSVFAILQAHHTEEATALDQLRPEVPTALAAVVAKMMAKEPGHRYQQPMEIAQALAPFLKTAVKAIPAGRPPFGGGKALGTSFPVAGIPAATPKVVGHETVAPGLVNRDTMFEFTGPIIQGKKKTGVQHIPSHKGKAKKWRVALGVCLCGLLLAVLGGLWAGGVFRVQTKDGVLVIQVNEPNADVFVDGDKVIVTWGADGKQAEVRVKPGTRQVSVQKDGFSAHGETVTLEDGGRQVIVARLERTGPGGALQQLAHPKTFTNKLGMEFVLVPKGKSWLGGGGGRFGDQEVEIAQDFYLGKYKVTQEEWQKVTGVNPSAFSRTGRDRNAVHDIPDADLKRFPVEQVSWHDVQVFLKLLNAQEKQVGWVYRLLKDAEWEFACRGGPLKDRFDSAFDYYFEKPQNELLPDQANVRDSGKGRTCKVGGYKPNSLGLYDMHGNTWEWCDDEVKGGDGALLRALRGGGWWHDSGYCRAAFHFAHPPSNRSSNNGARLARVPVGKEVVKIPPEEKKPPVPANLPAVPPPEEQVKAVIAKLKERNPGFEGRVESRIENGFVGELQFSTEAVVDISPLRAFPGLQRLNLRTERGKGKLADLTPLQGMPLTWLDLANCVQVQDLTPLQGMPLTWLSLTGCDQVRDLTPLQGMPLTWLSLADCNQVRDLTPLHGKVDPIV